MLTWDDPNARYYEHALDRGVLYLKDMDPIPWNGLTGLDESDGGSTTMYYRDGVVYLADADASDFSAKVTAVFWPDKFGECIGIPEATDGLFVDNQKPKQFNMAYRSLVGSGTKGDMFGYQIHLVYNCIASVGTRSRKTLSDTPETVEFAFDIVCTPVKLAGYRPTAHFIIDTRNMSSSTVAQIETILYGDADTPGTMPDPQVLFDLMNYGDAITVTVHTDGTFTVVGSQDNVFALDEYHFQMHNINGTDNGDGTYDISDGGTTDVILE
jgi:hypothetical protein